MVIAACTRGRMPSRVPRPRHDLISVGRSCVPIISQERADDRSLRAGGPAPSLGAANVVSSWLSAAVSGTLLAAWAEPADGLA